MITREDIDRINFLSRKSREQELSEGEKAEQQVLRRKYIDYIKSQVRTQMDSIEFVEDKKDGCGCGCGHNHVHKNDEHGDHGKHAHGSCGCGNHHHKHGKN